MVFLHPTFRTEPRTRLLGIPVSRHATDSSIFSTSAESNGLPSVASTYLPLSPKTTDPGARDTRSCLTPPSQASSSNTRPRKPSLTQRDCRRIAPPHCQRCSCAPNSWSHLTPGTVFKSKPSFPTSVSPPVALCRDVRTQRQCPQLSARHP